jgi:hypothetical protein
MTSVVISWLVPSEYVPEAVNCWVSPTGILGLIGVTDMEDSVAEVTVRGVGGDDFPPKLAVMVAVPAEMAVARPSLSTTATSAGDVGRQLHVTSVVISKFVPSEYPPEAANCWVSPLGILTGMLGGLTAVTDTEDRVAAVTVRNAFADIPPKVAVMVVGPAATAVAKPLLLSTVATDGLEEFQVTCVVISKLVPSEYAPEAANCWVCPTGMLTGTLGGLTAVTDMEDSVAGVTVRVVVPEIVPKGVVMEAVMVAIPAVMAAAKPLLSMIATSVGDVGDELQVTSLVISEVVPSEYAPEALNCWVRPTGMLRLAGVTYMEDMVAEVTVMTVVPKVGPVEKLLGMVEVAVMVVVPEVIAVVKPLLSIVATVGSDELHVTCEDISWVVWSFQ